MSPYTADLLNAIFEFIGFGVTLMSVRALYKDRMVRGVHWTTVAFFTGWGLWNLIYYPVLDQPFSFFGGALLAAANLWRIALMYKFRESAQDALSTDPGSIPAPQHSDRSLRVVE